MRSSQAWSVLTKTPCPRGWITSWKLRWGKRETALDEVVTMREPPRRKRCAITGEPHLLAIGPCEMGFALSDAGAGKTALRVDID